MSYCFDSQATLSLQVGFPHLYLDTGSLLPCRVRHSIRHCLALISNYLIEPGNDAEQIVSVVA